MDKKTLSIVNDKLIVDIPLFANEKRKTENHPNAVFFDKESGVGIAAWTYTAKSSGKRYQSCKIDIPVDALIALLGGQNNAPVSEPAQQATNDFEDEDLPF